VEIKNLLCSTAIYERGPDKKSSVHMIRSADDTHLLALRRKGSLSLVALKEAPKFGERIATHSNTLEPGAAYYDEVRKKHEIRDIKTKTRGIEMIGKGGTVNGS